MSIHVLKRKQDAKTKLTKQNQYASARNQPFSLNMTNRGSVRSVPVMGGLWGRGGARKSGGAHDDSGGTCST